MNRKFVGVLFVSLATVIWGLSGVAQSVGNDYMGVFTFNTCRSVIGSLCLVPAAWLSMRASGKRTDWRKLFVGGVLCGVLLGVGLAIQQHSFKSLMVGKVIFLTSLYVVIIPVLEWPRTGFPGVKFFAALAFVLVGLYMLSMKGGRFDFSRDEVLMLGCAAANALLIMAIDRYSKEVDCLALTSVIFATIAVLSAPAMFALESPSFAQLASGWRPLLYAGVLSSAAGYSCQALGQRYCEPTLASLLFSLETVYAALGGWLLLGQAMSGNEILGCALMFFGTLVAELPLDGLLRRR